MTEYTFQIVAGALSNMARIAHISYNEANIVVYFVVIPFIWAHMIDRAYKFHYIKLGYAALCAGVFIGCENYSAFCDHLFSICSRFLCLFYPVGIDYVTASVIFCVMVPVAMHFALLKTLKTYKGGEQ